MKFGNYLVCTVLTLSMAVLFCTPVEAHSVFKKELEKKFPDMKISCNACHISKQPKTERNAFGKMFHKQLESQELSKAWKSKKGADKKAYEKDVMVPAFDKAQATVMAMTYDQIILAGMVDGIDDPNAPQEESDEEEDAKEDE